MAHPLRLRVIAALADGRVHVSELARRLGMSRPLLYMHLDRLEKAGLVVGHLELSPDGKAMKFFELAPFELRITASSIVEALRADGSTADGSTANGDSANGDSANGDGANGESATPDPDDGANADSGATPESGVGDAAGGNPTHPESHPN